MLSFTARYKIQYDSFLRFIKISEKELADAPGEFSGVKEKMKEMTDLMQLFINGQAPDDIAGQISQKLNETKQHIAEYKESLTGSKYQKLNTLNQLLNAFSSTIDKHGPLVEKINADEKYIPEVAELTQIYENLFFDKDGHSAAFNSVKENLTDLLQYNGPEDNPAAYRRSLSKALDSAKYYLQQHRKDAEKENPPKRVAEILRLKDNLNNKLTVLEDRRKAQIEEELTALSRKVGADKSKANAEDLHKLSRLQRNIGPSKLIPKQPSFNPEPSKMSKLWGSIKHGLFSTVYATIGTVLGNIIALPTTIKGWIKNDDSKLTAYAENHIPGFEHYVKFDEIKLSDDPNQDILDDVRRTPIRFEEEIPSDPSLPPSITIKSMQGREGDSRAYANGEMGHSFVSLEYSRKDPISGTMKRYRSSFGFYPQGGFQRAGDMSAMYVEGRHVPGIILNDFDHEASIGKKFIINNKQVNEVFLAASKFEKDGYNYLKRNCASFTNEMAKVAGIDTSKIFNVTGIDVGVGQKIASGFLAIGGGVLLKRRSTNRFYDKAQRDDISYNKLGQKLVTENDINNLNKDEFNIKSEGYTPAHSAESMRIRDKGSFYSDSYTGIKPQKNAEPDPRAVMNDATAEFNNLLAKLKAFELRRKVDLSSEIEKFTEYGQNCLALLNKSFDATVEINDDFIAEAECKNGTKYAEEFTEGLSDILIDTFKNDPSLNIPFMHMISTVSHLKDNFKTKYHQLQTGKIPNKGLNDNYKYATVDNSRDISKYLVQFKFDSRFYESKKVTPGSLEKGVVLNHSRVAAMIQVCGNLQEAIDLTVEMKNLQAKKKPSSKDKTRLNSLNLYDKLFNQFEATQKYYMGKKEYTEEDIRFAFYDLPLNETAIGMNVSKINPRDPSVSTIYQMPVFESVLKGSREEIKEAVLKYHQERQEQFLNTVSQAPYKGDDRAIIDYAKKFNEKSQNDINNIVAPIVFGKLMKDDNTIYKAISANSFCHNGNQEEAYKYVINSIVDAYIAPLVSEAAMNAISKLPKDLPPMSRDAFFNQYHNAFMMKNIEKNPALEESFSKLKEHYNIAQPMLEKDDIEVKPELKSNEKTAVLS